jgi:hypothetical protein
LNDAVTQRAAVGDAWGAYIVRGILLGAKLQQQLRALDVAILNGMVQRRFPILRATAHGAAH